MKGTINKVHNPYLPSWEYVPDGEPYVFGDRVYVYGSHDFFGGCVYCMGDYVCWSAPVNDLSDWRYEGVIYKKAQDPRNADLQGNLYAPDVTVGPDGRYYLYYVLSNCGIVSVAVCDTPAGKYEFYGYVHYSDGTLLGNKSGDEPQFDPGVITENGIAWLYTGFCQPYDKSRHGAMCVSLASDMLTVLSTPVFIAPSAQYSKGSGFEEHEFFEAPSIRKKDGKYWFIYSSVKCHELCYAVSDRPNGGFVYKGVLSSGGDLHIDSYKPAEMCSYYTANNHGSMVEIAGEWYIFYHRHTNGTNYSRQGCFEKLHFSADGTAMQPEMTSNCGCEPFEGEGVYPAYIACNLFCEGDGLTYVPWSGWLSDKYPKITQSEGDGTECDAFIANMRSGAIAGFKYFDIKGLKRIGIRTMGYATGKMEVCAAWDGPVLAEIPVHYANVWYDSYADISIPDGVSALYFRYKGDGHLQFKAFELIKG